MVLTMVVVERGLLGAQARKKGPALGTAILSFRLVETSITCLVPLSIAMASKHIRSTCDKDSVAAKVQSADTDREWATVLAPSDPTSQLPKPGGPLWSEVY